MKKIYSALFCLLAPLALATDITIEDAWARATTGSMRTSAVYATIHNHGTTDLVLQDASSPLTSRVELHTHTENAQGVMQMTQLEEIVMPAGSKHVFQPGADHIMLLNLTQPLEVGNEIPLRLEFADGSFRNFRAVIRPLGHRMKHNHKHNHHDHH